MTGHVLEDSSLDWRALAAPRHTVVFYMGVAHLARIVAKLRAAGASADHPVAIIEAATLPQQRILRGVLATISAIAHNANVAPPAVLIVGEVAAFGAVDALVPASARDETSAASGALA